MRKKLTGFTLIELLIVIAIIGILGAGLLVMLNPVAQIDKAKYAQAKSDINQLVSAMTAYKVTYGELPPTGDLCSSCANPPNSTWTRVIDALINAGEIKRRIDTDPWGNYYGYDDNDCNSGAPAGSKTYLFTAGPDHLNNTTDDFKVLVSSGC